MTAPDRSARNELAQRIRDALSSHGTVCEVNMFGGLSFMVDDRMAVAAGRDGDLLVRTDPADHADLLRRGGEPAFMGTGRPMGDGWLTVPAARIEADTDLAFWVGVGLASGKAGKSGQTPP